MRGGTAPVTVGVRQWTAADQAALAVAHTLQLSIRSPGALVEAEPVRATARRP